MCGIKNIIIPNNAVETPYYDVSTHLCRKILLMCIVETSLNVSTAF